MDYIETSEQADLMDLKRMLRKIKLKLNKDLNNYKHGLLLDKLFFFKKNSFMNKPGLLIEFNANYLSSFEFNILKYKKEIKNLI